MAPVTLTMILVNDDSGRDHRLRRDHGFEAAAGSVTRPRQTSYFFFVDLRVNLDLHRIANRRFATL